MLSLFVRPRGHVSTSASEESSQRIYAASDPRESSRRLQTIRLTRPLNDQNQAVQLGLNRFRLCERVAPLRPHLNPAGAFPVSDEPIELFHFPALDVSGCRLVRCEYADNRNKGQYGCKSQLW